jgi:hypothetical protein
VKALICIVLLAAGSATWKPVFRNVAQERGLVQTFPNGGVASKQYIIETTGSGAAFIDYNNDGLLDIFLVAGEGGTNRLYRNDGQGQFTDVTREAGLTSGGWGQGVCAGDYDNDGLTDLFVTYYGQNALYHNVEGRRFENVTRAAGLIQDRTRYNTGCAFIDYDRDGHLDLFVSNYLRFDLASAPKPGANPYCWYRGLAVNCGPRGLAFDRNILYHNDGKGHFTDVSQPSGIAAPSQNYSLGVVTGDFNHDGWPDVFVACDQTPSILYINRHDGTFRDEAMFRGAALDENGKALSGMGATAGDYDGDGWLDIFRTNFSDERETLYRNARDGTFEEVTQAAGMARNTRFVGWGCGFFDFDNDGWTDLLLVNGHAFPEVDRLNIDVRSRDRAVLYRNTGRGTFVDISDQAGPAIQERHSARGAAFGDFDNDGAVEVLVNNQNEPPSLWKLQNNAAAHWIILKLEGTRSNRSAIGARLELTAGGRTQTDEVRSGGSYLSQSDLRVHFGLGEARSVDRLAIEWPSGGRQELRNLRTDAVITLRENISR